ncbi:MAG: proline--tRNA ligase [Acidobacteriota bacterium]
MRWSNFYLFTSREVPSDAEVVSHQLMSRAGMLRKMAAGIYVYQPLAWRSIQKLMTIVRREMEVAGSAELAMPAVQPAELWEESGRWQKYGKELLRIRDRHDRDFCFGPTHEEIITDVVRRDISSYRQLPVNLYQIQTKFRDEIRPRFGLMRGREFLMKDAYSFHADDDSLHEAYEAMHAAYCRILEACGLNYTVVEADSGAIGGSWSHEFMVLAETGEDAIVHCDECGYAANVEKATTELVAPETEPAAEATEVPTPGMSSCAEVAEHLGVPIETLVKTLLYETDQGIVAVVLRGDRDVNEVKLGNELDATFVRLASEQQVREVTGAPVGFAGPVGLEGVTLMADESVRELKAFISGANAADTHLQGVTWGRDAEPARWVDVVQVGGGDPCPRCSSTLVESRGVESGHIFKLGTVYSEPMGCTFSFGEGEEKPMTMGCYGFGVSRTIAACIEQNHDEDGIIWPRPLAPFEVLVVALNSKDETVVAAAEEIYGELKDAGYDVLFDDRDERPGVKFKDADLVGFPARVVIGAKSLANGQIEVSDRRSKERQDVARESVVEAVGKLLEDA